MNKNKRRKKPQPIPKPIAFQDGTIAVEDLPFPIVHYPSHYGAFFAFQRDKYSPIVLCSCTKKAIINYVGFRRHQGYNKLNLSRGSLLDPFEFPLHFIVAIVETKFPSDQVPDNLPFQDRLCHECNLAVPKYRYCDEMYGGKFMQTYGWYVNKMAYELGVCHWSYMLFPNVQNHAPELKALYKIPISPYVAMTGDIAKEAQKQSRKIHNYIENKVREIFGYKKVGEAWTNETLLYTLVMKLFPEFTIHHHYRPDFLEGLELDIYIEEINVGIEYQGIQHFEPVEHWGGVDALRRTQERDQRKNELCTINGIRVIYFYYYEDLTEELVKHRIQVHM
ncbi:hypothetical protein G3578_07635 [Brevibacillus sp. SYP-B805]|uniref:hypothetical protein n=1 Tax=Brevibacillus sp. SYP-B805 TaxID=1578199 RepID=UPI0013EB08AE|nr:hypothetical protein [Brevibacillus sp. SYP-B805]NGQ95055.1 hypothetical protein [Brevibacillus sp. SYP-B805]